MALINCNECSKQISDKAKVCPNCGNPVKKKREEKVIDEQTKLKRHKLIKKISIILGILLIIGIILSITIPILLNNIREKNVLKHCEEFTNRMQTYIDNKDFEGFDDNWFNHEDLSTEHCDTIECSCPSAWNLYLEKRLLQAKDYYNEGLISSAYNVMGSMYLEEDNQLKEFHDKNDLFKLISSKSKENITGIYHSAGSWKWEFEVGGEFKFNKRIVHYASSNLSLLFSDFNDQVLISGHIASKEHPNWNSEKNIAVEWFDYKIKDNKIIQLKSKNENEYDDMFEIVSLTDTELKLKLLINTTDVNIGQIYVMKYERT